MDKRKLESVMKLHGDNGNAISKYLGIARSTFSVKLNEKNGYEFTKREISLLKKRYSFTAEDVDKIFFN